MFLPFVSFRFVALSLLFYGIFFFLSSALPLVFSAATQLLQRIPLGQEGNWGLFLTKVCINLLLLAKSIHIQHRCINLLLLFATLTGEQQGALLIKFFFLDISDRI